MATGINGQAATDAATAQAMQMQDQATAKTVMRQTQQNIESAEADAAISNAQQVGQTLSRASSV
jgi:hypothetical protein